MAAPEHVTPVVTVDVPSVPEYVERSKAISRVDWQHWQQQRVSVCTVLPSNGNAWDGGEEGIDEDGAEDVYEDATEGEASGNGRKMVVVVPQPLADNGDSDAAASELASPVREDASMASYATATSFEGGATDDDWTPETLAKQTMTGTGDTIELVHTCCDGSRFVAATVPVPEVPLRAEHRFNRDQKRTISALLKGDEPEVSDRAHSHDEIAKWLLTSSKLSKNRMGDYLGRADDDPSAILRAFLSALDLSVFEAFDEALRFFLSLFRLPGEAQQIDRIMQTFARAYHEARPGTFGSADTAYVLAFSIIMLNTDAHSPQIEHKMTLAQFLRNNRGIDEGGDLPEMMLTQLFHSIVEHEIRMEQREYIASDKEGWLLKQGGRVKTWKRRYTILSGNVLYYFKSPKDRAPAGFVPLEGIEVKAHPERLVFELAPAEGKSMKSVRMGGAPKPRSRGCNLFGCVRRKPPGATSTQGFARGHHTVFRFRVVDSNTEQFDAWVRAVREHVVKAQVRSKPTGAVAKHGVAKPLIAGAPVPPPQAPAPAPAV